MEKLLLKIPVVSGSLSSYDGSVQGQDWFPQTQQERLWYAYHALADQSGRVPRPRALEQAHDLSNGSLQKYISGVYSDPRGSTLAKLARALKTTADWITDGAGDAPVALRPVPPPPSFFSTTPKGSRQLDLRGQAIAEIVRTKGASADLVSRAAIVAAEELDHEPDTVSQWVRLIEIEMLLALVRSSVTLDANGSVHVNLTGYPVNPALSQGLTIAKLSDVPIGAMRSALRKHGVHAHYTALEWRDIFDVAKRELSTPRAPSSVPAAGRRKKRSQRR